MMTLTQDALLTGFRGELITPDDSRYDEARAVWNGMIDRRPALIAQCKDTMDVIQAVHFAREKNMLLAVRGGGHNVAGLAVCDGGMVIDLSGMKGIVVNLSARTARAEAGVTWGELDRATQAYGLATPGGVVSETGIAGLTLGGGLGWLRRKYGLSSDNLSSVEIVTADGRLLTASETENADLFWGIRGGGGNFGIVTAFEYRLHPVGPEVMMAFVLYPFERAAEVLTFFREFAADAPDEISAFAVLGSVPAEPAYPEALHHKDYVLLAACYAGSVAEGRRLLQPLREQGEPMLDLSAPIQYVDMQMFLDADYPAGKLRYYWKSVYLNSLSDDAIDHLIMQAASRPSSHSTIDIWQLGGAISRFSPDASAFRNRHSPFLIGVEANWENQRDDVANMEWTRSCIQELQMFSDGSQYMNFPGFLEEGEQQMRTSFGRNYDRLVELKKKYDPTNLFRLNHNVKP